MSNAATIYALASAPGKAGVAVYRLSGPSVRDALRGLGVEKTPAPRVATLVTLRNNDKIIDQALALYFPAPNSFTGEEVLELHTHGSRATQKLLLEALNGLSGCRMAEPGEFARRAFLNGKMDLAQAEGLADLIDAETAAQHAQATRQFGGAATKRVEALREAVLEPYALLEAWIDFPDEEIPASVLHTTQQRVGELEKEISELLADNQIGEKIREGLHIVLIGPPNAGKSSLLNALAKRDAAIVSDIAGTTRDLIEVHMEIGGYAVTLVDTAGLRDTENAIEAEGIRRTRARAGEADMVIYLQDIVDSEIYDHKELREVPCIALATKIDLHTAHAVPRDALPISIRTGEGMAEFLAILTDKIAGLMDHHTPPLITRARHREALNEALDCLRRFSLDSPLELACEELRLAARAIGKITGKIAVDDVLDLVFSRFCIGK